MKVHLVVLAAVNFAAMAQPAHRFDVASVKVVQPSGMGHGMYGQEEVIANPGTLTMRNMRLRGLIKWAYDVKEYQIAGPGWLGSPSWRGNDLARFEVAAKAGEAPVPELRKMLQALLSERFRLQLHREKREADVFVVTGKGSSSLKPATDPKGASKCVPNGPTLTCENARIGDILEMLAVPLGAPAVDESGLNDPYNFTIDAPDIQPGDDPVPAIMRSVQQALGVKFEKGKRPIEMLVIDKLEKTPSEN